MVRLGSVTQIINGDRSSNYPSGDDFQNVGVPFINAGHLQNGKVNYSSMDYISHEKYNQLSGAKIQRNDILLCLRGSLGKYAFVTTDGGAPASSIAVIRPNAEKIDSRYLSQIIASSIFQKQIEVENNGSSQPNLSAKSVSDFEIPLPSLKEQQKIASALYGTDAMIDFLEKQLCKKKAIKLGAMQELLTGKKRLPGFSGEWQTIPLTNALTVGHGMSQHNVESPTGKYPILATGGEIGKATTYLWDKPSVLIGRKGTINKPQYMDRPFWSIDTLFYTKIKEGYYPKFLYYVFCQIEWLNYNEASGVPSLSAKTIESIEVQVPEYAEQIAIAELLSEMDSEIGSLEQKLTKYRQVKQGMMQQLLTGKIRLTK